METIDLAGMGGMGVLGVISGFAVKKMLKIGVMIAGFCVLLVAYLDSKTAFDIKWEQSASVVEGLDIGALSSMVVDFVLGFAPAVGGFSAGFMIGFYRG